MKLDLTPPTETATVHAERVLVLAPHSDDEIFGCGGLLAGLAAAGAEIAVLYLTDSSGGAEVTADQEAYAARRHAEAEKGLALIGVREFEALAIPDGDLAAHVDAAAEAITRRLREHRPDLLLSVSPCEVTADHRAAFAALHRTLSPLRGGSELDGIMARCRILLYEVFVLGAGAIVDPDITFTTKVALGGASVVSFSWAGEGITQIVGVGPPGGWNALQEAAGWYG